MTTAITPEALFERLQRVFRDVFDDDSLVLRPELTARDLDGWDSLTHITLVVSAEKEFGIRLNAAEIARLANVGEMAEAIRRHLKE
jgi:acyl carrier protein